MKVRKKERDDKRSVQTVSRILCPIPSSCFLNLTEKPHSFSVLVYMMIFLLCLIFLSLFSFSYRPILFFILKLLFVYYIS